MSEIHKKTIFTVLIQPINALIATIAAIGTMIALYILMAKLPGTNGYACIEGGNLTTINISTSAIISIFTGIIIIGFKEVFKSKKQSLHIGSTSSIALLLGSLTTICTVCALPIISLFGISISLQFVTTHNTAFKIISLAFMMMSIYLLNKNLKQECQVCSK